MARRALFLLALAIGTTGCGSAHYGRIFGGDEDPDMVRPWKLVTATYGVAITAWGLAPREASNLEFHLRIKGRLKSLSPWREIASNPNMTKTNSMPNITADTDLGSRASPL